MLVERVARGNTNIANSLHSNNNPQEENIDVLPASIRIPRLAQIFSKICAERIEYTLAIANRRKSKYRRAVRYSSEPSQTRFVKNIQEDLNRSSLKINRSKGDCRCLEIQQTKTQKGELPKVIFQNEKIKKVLNRKKRLLTGMQQSSPYVQDLKPNCLLRRRLRAIHDANP